MYRVLICVTQEHMPVLLGLAATVCLGSLLIGIVLLQRSMAVERPGRLWLPAAGVTAGVGVWATHFLAMLAYDPGFLVRYDVGWTAASLAVAALLAWPAFAVARSAPSLPGSCVAGTLFGLAIAGTHNIGMLGVVFPGSFVWDTGAVLTSDALGCLFSAAGLEALRRDALGRGRVLAVLCLFCAVLVLHFLGIGTVVAVPDPRVVATGWTVPREILAVAIAAAMAAILTLGACAAWLDARVATAVTETARVRQLADAAMEGIVILRGPVIADVNRSLATLVGLDAGTMIGRPFDALFGGVRLPEDEAGAVEASLRSADGTALPVELRARTVALAQGDCRVVAVRDLRERRAAEEHIRFLARHDPLTGLLNRAALQGHLGARIGEAAARGHQLAALCLDLDRFKQVNDAFGHPVGDALLRAVADRLRGLVRADDAICRLGGDEFVVVQADVTGPGDVRALATRIVAALGTPFLVEGRHLAIGVSVGAALFPADGLDADHLLRNADTALYKAKGEGRGRFALFDPSLAAALRRRRDIEQNLGQALARGELGLVYQPQVSARTGRVSGYEALLRWRSPRFGDVPPGRFIPVAEETGLVVPIGAWALREACRAAAAWEPAVCVAVNLSPVQVQDAGLASLVEGVLAETGLDPARLELEITETALIGDRDRAAWNLRRLQALGVRIALDDFGTGYSSLSYLQEFPFDTLKIDRRFVARITGDPASAAIVDAVIRLGHALGLAVVAEGVETEAQREALRAGGCDALQGYLLGAPAALPARRESAAA